MTSSSNAGDEELDRILENYKEYVTGVYQGITDYDEGVAELAIQTWSAQQVREALEKKIDGNTSDGYHTFNELYEFRMLYNAAFFNAMKDDPNWGHGEHKSWRHSDGELCFGGGWFIVMATLPTGQISNHYEAKDWDLFQIEEREKADEWDGHNPRDVAKRLHEFLAIANQGIEEGRDI